MAMLYDVVCDELQRDDIPDDAEIEVRVPVAASLVDTLRLLMFGRSALCTYSCTSLQYNDKTDIRCVDGTWQRKRNLLYTRLPSKVRCSLVVSVESPARPPQLPFRSARRERWSYNREAWRVDFTRGERNSNIEVEYIGAISSLGSSLASLRSILDNVMACMAYSVYGKGTEPGVVDMPFVRMDMQRCPVTRVQRQSLVDTMQRCQPISLLARSPALRHPLVSLKYDGVRVSLSVVRRAAGCCVVGVCRRGLPWSIPCLSADVEMSLDCEYVHATRTFIVFDLLLLRGRTPTADYRTRLRDLAQLRLPVLACGLAIECKTMYPMCALTPSWYASKAALCDGLILHDGEAKLSAVSAMYKWKTSHTVDLYVSTAGTMMDGKYTDFLPLCSGHGKTLVKGDIWECAFEQGGACVRPLRCRRDKPRANARHVCREIRQAFRDDLSADDVRVQMTQDLTTRVSKRKREPI